MNTAMNAVMNAAANGIASSRPGGALGSDGVDMLSAPSAARTVVFAAFLAVAFVGFVGLGVWQLQRMAWKDALI
uniref:SURF1 family cytochrome oxidase biogenesis protein n=1 Tax=Brevundimonas aurantiaca TaxID=74316 RepID=UPI0037C00BE6